MYHVVVRDKTKVIASALREGLAEAVAFGRRRGSEGNRISVYDAVQDAEGNIVHLHKSVSLVIPKK